MGQLQEKDHGFAGYSVAENENKFIYYIGKTLVSKDKYHTCRKPSIDTDWTVLPRPISSAKTTFVSFIQL